MERLSSCPQPHSHTRQVWTHPWQQQTEPVFLDATPYMRSRPLPSSTCSFSLISGTSTAWPLGTNGLQLWLHLKIGVTWGKSLNLSEPQLPHLQNGSDNNTNFTGLLWWLSDVKHVKPLALSLATSKCSIKEKKKILDLITPGFPKHPELLDVPSTWNILCSFTFNSYSSFKMSFNIHLFFRVFLPFPSPYPAKCSFLWHLQLCPRTWLGLRSSSLMLNLCMSSWIKTSRVGPRTCVMLGFSTAEDM